MYIFTFSASASQELEIASPKIVEKLLYSFLPRWSKTLRDIKNVKSSCFAINLQSNTHFYTFSYYLTKFNRYSISDMPSNFRKRYFFIIFTKFIIFWKSL